MASITQWSADVLRSLSTRYIASLATPIDGSVELGVDVPVAAMIVVTVTPTGTVDDTKKYMAWADLRDPVERVLISATVKDDGVLHIIVANYSGVALPAHTRVDFLILRAF